jgi:hypothetical protein
MSARLFDLSARLFDLSALFTSLRRICARYIARCEASAAQSSDMSLARLAGHPFWAETGRREYVGGCRAARPGGCGAARPGGCGAARPGGCGAARLGALARVASERRADLAVVPRHRRTVARERAGSGLLKQELISKLRVITGGWIMCCAAAVSAAHTTGACSPPRAGSAPCGLNPTGIAAVIPACLS